MLREQEPVELLAARLDPELAQEPPHQRGVVDLVEPLARRQRRQVLGPESRRQLGARLPAERPQTGVVTIAEQPVVPHPPHQRVAPVEEHGLQHQAGRVPAWRGRSSGASLFVLPSLSLVMHYVVGVGQVADFVFAALALLPLAWVIGEATEHAAEHTGAGIGGFLNASFGNAPELIIALIAVCRRPSPRRARHDRRERRLEPPARARDRARGRARGRPARDGSTAARCSSSSRSCSGGRRVHVHERSGRCTASATGTPWRSGACPLALVLLAVYVARHRARAAPPSPPARRIRPRRSSPDWTWPHRSPCSARRRSSRRS